jgi:peptidoglycan/xylan/chitin deacetylase (PgdA/CDA1 family)
MTRLPHAAALAAAVLLSTISAAPVTTVPWNGKTGAVSFTYDDARTSQIPNLIPQLDSLGLKATFFISIQNIGDFNARRAAWIQAARKGHELTNHTYAHANVNGSDGAAVTAMIKDMADTLRKIDTSIQSVTFAYPNCNLTANTTAKNGISAENFMARGCANPTLNWGTQPTDWMNIPGEILGPTSASSAVSRINAAKTNNRWYITILHDVAESPDQYSMTPANNLTMLAAAVSAGVWIDTYSAIGAYYRAHFTMDTAQAVVSGNGKKVQWVVPHAKMPRSVPLRVKLDKAVFGDTLMVVQDGKTLSLQPDTSYIVDFMKPEFMVFHGVTALSPGLRMRHAPLSARASGGFLQLKGLPPGLYILTVRDLKGALVQQRSLRATGSESRVKFDRDNGMFQVTLRQHATGVTRSLRFLAVR